jgi:adenylate cyclase class 2
MKEIEVKAKLKNKEKVLNSLETLGAVLSLPIAQDGTEYAKTGNTLSEYLSNDHFVRIRTENGVHKMTVKKPSKDFALAKLEFESKIENREEIEKALMIMGYNPVLRIKKIRQKAKYKEYEICIDEVEELGSFIEIEKMSDEDEGTVIAELQTLLFSLGIEKEDEVKKGYDILIFEKK